MAGGIQDGKQKPPLPQAGSSFIERIAGLTQGITAVVGFVDQDTDLHNAAAVLHDGELVGQSLGREDVVLIERMADTGCDIQNAHEALLHADGHGDLGVGIVGRPVRALRPGGYEHLLARRGDGADCG